MEGSSLESQDNAVAEVKTVKCSMCRKSKTTDHFINPNSDQLFHVCDYCRYLRKTKYKSRILLFVHYTIERRVRVELERPVCPLSRTRESGASGVGKTTRLSSQSTAVSREATIVQQSPKPVICGIVPSRKWVVTSDGSSSASSSPPEFDRRPISCQVDSRYAVNHPYYRYQSLLTSLCNPPQFVYNSEFNRMDVVRSSIPPAPKALIFCCSNPLYGHLHGMYNPVMIKREF